MRIMLIAAAVFAVFLMSAPVMAAERTDLLPRIVERAPDVLQRMVCPENPEECLEVIAAYDSGVIFLREGYQPDSHRQISVLLHELVHHLQHIGAVQYPCRTAAEGPAYRVQEAWLRAHGKDPQKEGVPNDFTKLFITSCPGEW